MSDTNELAEQLTAYIDGELSELERKRVEEALEADPALLALEQRLRSAVTAMQQLQHPEPSAQLRRAVLTRLDQPLGFGERLRSLFTLPRLVTVGAAAAVVAVGVAVVGHGGSEQPLADDPEQLVVAQNLEVLEDLEVMGLENADDLDVVASLHELEVTP